MATRTPSHQLSSGLYVSGRPEQHKQRQPTMSSRAVPYTGGSVNNSGELSKNFDLSSNVSTNPKPSRSSLSSQNNSGSFRSIHNSASFNKSSNSGSFKKKSSGSIPLQPTGLITSGPIGSSGGGGVRRSAQLEPSDSMKKTVYGAAVTSLGQEVKFGLKVSKAIMWVFVVAMLMALVIGVFMMATVKNAVILVVVVGVLVPVVLVMMWNFGWGKRGIIGFLNRYPDADLRHAADGQFVKISGVVTCGSFPLESSYQRVPRCVYVSTELYEYKGWGGKSANSKHLPLSWGLRYFEKHVAEFYISDNQSGARALVKAGFGAKVAPFVKPATVVDISKENRDLSPSFIRWLTNRNLSSDDRIMRLEEGYIKEGSNISVMGIVQHHDNVVMIIPSVPPASTGCQWIRCLLPTYIEGLILYCDESQNADVIPV